MRWSLLGLIWINHPIFIPNDLTHTHIHPNEVGQQDPSGMATSWNPQNWTAAGAFPTQPMIRGAVSALDTLHDFSNPSIGCPVMAFDTGHGANGRAKNKGPSWGCATSRKSRWLMGIVKTWLFRWANEAVLFCPRGCFNCNGNNTCLIYQNASLEMFILFYVPPNENRNTMLR
jgi:hypothetical protein